MVKWTLNKVKTRENITFYESELKVSRKTKVITLQSLEHQIHKYIAILSVLKWVVVQWPTSIFVLDTFALLFLEMNA